MSLSTEQAPKKSSVPGWYAILSAVIITVLVFVVVYLLVAQIGTTNSIHRDQLASCKSSNKTRAKTKRVLEEIINLPAVSRPQFIKPAEARKQVIAIGVLHTVMNKNYQPTNCAAVYKVP